ncbi:hypothetical protein L1987_38341 [Smallanthus sonchifolius]|uniref:Uncharacterized protein n=1 Tax=Smallanthus sonchifolius TaxID=185202 RepID=A0ACB9HIC9_9ASTR|nr:hypothetical protein L1987_38341 [Smallanthus sonchifolius]
MAPEKVTEMVLNVDLKCSGCYKKVKKVICKIPQIRDQVFDVDKNKVRIMVVCCSPEKIRDKLCYKGGGAIQSIEIVEKPEKPKPAGDKPKEAEKPKPGGDKPKEPEKPKPAGDKSKDSGKPKEPEKPKPNDKPKPADKPKEPEKPKPADKPKGPGKPAEPQKAKPKDGDKPGSPKEAPKKADAGPNPDVAKMVYEPVHGYPQMYPPSGYPMVGYGQYHDHGYGGGYGGAPFQHGYGMPIAPPPPPSYGGFGYESGYNGNRSHYGNDYGGEDEGEGCSIM